MTGIKLICKHTGRVQATFPKEKVEFLCGFRGVDFEEALYQWGKYYYYEHILPKEKEL